MKEPLITVSRAAYHLCMNMMRRSDSPSMQDAASELEKSSDLDQVVPDLIQELEDCLVRENKYKHIIMSLKTDAEEFNWAKHGFVTIIRRPQSEKIGEQNTGPEYRRVLSLLEKIKSTTL